MTTEQYKVLSAMRDGRPYTLWPMMRKAFLAQSRRWIVAIGPAPAASDERHAKAPVRPFAITDAGLAACAAYERGPERQLPVPCGPLRIRIARAQ